MVAGAAAISAEFIVTVDFTIKDTFFDRAAIIAAMEEATYWAMYRGGAMIRTRAIRAQKPKPYGQYSPPGSAPYSHVEFQRRKFLREENKRRRKLGMARLAKLEGGFKGLRHILYGWDDSSKSMLIGPVGIGPAIVPGLMEFGGSATRVRYEDGKSRPVSFRYRPRPFMRPALEAVAPRLPEEVRFGVGGGSVSGDSMGGGSV